MKKALLFLLIVCLFLCNMLQAKSLKDITLLDNAMKIETLKENSYNKPQQVFSDTFFITGNVQNSMEGILQGFGFLKNHDFNIKNLFITLIDRTNFIYTKNEYLLSYSFNPRAP